MLVGRERERAALDAVLTGARVGRSGVLVLSGEAGIGKSTLLEDLVERAVEHRMPVLRATGVRSEQEVPFGGLLQLVRPVLGVLPALPAPQAQALGSALALLPGSGDERFAVGAATLSLVSRVAEDAPLLCVVDDAHLLDVPSAQALSFAARRLSADPVALVLAVRDDVPSVVGEADLPTLALRGLAADDAAAVIGRVSRVDAERLHALTGGNPLALLELARDVDALAALPPEAPVPVPRSVADAFAQRAAGLSDDARRALLVAASGVEDLGVVAEACRRLGVDVTALDEAEAAGLLTVAGGRVVVRHGLVRSGVWSRATPAQRREVHAALAAVLPADDVDRRAWHLAEAARGPDPAVAAVVAEAAGRAAGRGAHAVAAAGLRRAASLATDRDEQAAHLVAAAESAWRAGSAETVLDVLGVLVGRRLPRDLSIRRAVVDASVAARTGAPSRAYETLVAAADEVAADEPDRAAELLADAVAAAQAVGDVAGMAAAAARIEDLPPLSSTRATWVSLVATGMARVVAGTGGADALERAATLAREDPDLLTDAHLAPWVVLGALYRREDDDRDQVAAVMRHARSRTDIGVLPSLLFYLGRDLATTDRWDDAVAAYSEGAQLAREAGQSTDLAACLAGWAWVEARRGAPEHCRRLADEALGLCRDRRLGFFEVWARTALAELALGLGRAGEALEGFREVEAILRRLGVDDVDLAPGPELVEALLRVGATEDAQAEAERYAVRARAKGRPWSLARAHRAVGLVGPDDEVDASFVAALEEHGRTLDAFETARTRLAYGARLRRARRRVDARPVLRAAVEAFDRLGARPWADLAAGELKATGEVAVRRGAPGSALLTPQERQVARTVADGATTREAAAALFLSPKTVEFHLRNVYGKLGIRSRGELAGALADDDR